MRWQVRGPRTLAAVGAAADSPAIAAAFVSETARRLVHATALGGSAPVATQSRTTPAVPVRSPHPIARVGTAGPF